MNFWWFSCIKESDLRYSILLLKHNESKKLKYVLLTFGLLCSLSVVFVLLSCLLSSPEEQRMQEISHTPQLKYLH
jgi:hypothetical protein